MGLIFPIYLYRKLKILLVRNQWTDFNITWQECFFGDPLPRLFKLSWSSKNMAATGQGLFFSICLYKKLKKSSRKKPLDQAQCSLARMLLLWPSTRMVQAFMICQKTWPPGGGAYFLIYICIENFKMLLVKYLLTNFNNALVTLYQECSSNPYLSKNMPASGLGLFSLYI